MKRTKITLPTYEELRGKVCLATDYAIATGVFTGPGFWRDRGDGVKGYTGEAWLCTSSFYDTVDVFDSRGRKESNYAVADTIGVMPRFRNPKAMGIGVMTVDGRSYLTFNEEIVYYPGTFVGKRMSKHLTQALLKNKDIQAVGRLSSGRDIMEYKGNFYVYNRTKHYNRDKFRDGTEVDKGETYWFTNTRVLADECEDGSIQCREILVAHPFESKRKFHQMWSSRCFSENAYSYNLNTDNFEIGDFLNKNLMEDMRLCTDLEHHKVYDKLHNVKFTFGGLVLKHYDDNIERNY